MPMLRVYCDTGGYRSELAALENRGVIQVCQFKYENRNRRIRRGATPSKPSWTQLKYQWTELRRATPGFEELSWNSLGKHSERFSEILAIIGAHNRADAQHIDSAYASGCSVFLTSDKDDILSKRSALRSVTGMMVLHVKDDWNEFLQMVSHGDGTSVV
jgi:hypothetical protein